jgi:hypothetical protein
MAGILMPRMHCIISFQPDPAGLEPRSLRLFFIVFVPAKTTGHACT